MKDNVKDEYFQYMELDKSKQEVAKIIELIREKYYG